MAKVEGTFLVSLREWHLPSWLQPMPYRLPVLPGFEQQSVVVLAVVPEQTPATALSRTVEYFLETGNPAQAAAAAQGLRRYPADLGAWTARAEVEAAQNDGDNFARSIKVIQAYLKAKRDRNLPWDLRVSLAVVLAKDKARDASREQVQQCLEEIDATRLRTLSTGSLYRLLVLAKAYGLPIADPDLRALALSLLPAEARDRL
jgi:hypothetical protein